MNEATSRVRKHGTVVTVPTTPEERIAAFRQIAERGRYAKIDGYMVDYFSACAVVAVYDALNEENRARFCQLSAPKMAKLAFKFVK